MKCENPKRCGSDGVDCCNPSCRWSPWYAFWRQIVTKAGKA